MDSATTSRTRTVPSPGGAELFVAERGDPSAPTVLLVHGYPDTHRCWDELADLLEPHARVIAYDVRGFGASTLPAEASPYRLGAVIGDLAAVIDAVSPSAPVHLVGHDWGAMQCWAALASGRIDGRAASFTCIAGTRLDMMGDWTARRLRAGPRGIAQVIRQAVHSWYIGFFMIPRLPELVLRARAGHDWDRWLRHLERVEARPGHPAGSLVNDAINGIGLYRENLRPGRRRAHGSRERPAGPAQPRRSRRDRPGPVAIPVAVVIPLRDNYLTPALYDDASEWALDVRRIELDTGHWVQRTHPEPIAAAVLAFVREDESGGSPLSGAASPARSTAA